MNKTIEINNYLDIPKNFTGNICHTTDKTKIWCKEGKYHRDDGPAIEYINGQKEWLKNGLLHREDGPAVEYSNGDKEWWIEGKRHRIDGPAIEYNDEEKYWCVDDDFFSPTHLIFLFQASVFLEKQKGKYDLDWLRFLTEKGIEEFPIIPEMEKVNGLKLLLNEVFGETSK